MTADKNRCSWQDEHISDTSVSMWLLTSVSSSVFDREPGLNRLSHILQTQGSSPVCDLMCRVTNPIILYSDSATHLPRHMQTASTCSSLVRHQQTGT